jgi:glutamate-ammonia-ligase adenylyltransferase
VSISPSDLFLSSTLTAEAAHAYLKTFGLREPAAADAHLQAAIDDLSARDAMAAAIGPLLEAVRTTPDPDGALVAFCRYLATRAPKAAFLRHLAANRHALRTLVDVLGASPLLGEYLIRNPDHFHWLVDHMDAGPLTAGEMAAHAVRAVEHADGPTAQGDALKRFRRRDLLRIGARDTLGRDTLEAATRQLSDLADVVVEMALRLVTTVLCAHTQIPSTPGRVAVIGMGKLGGRELNYSSDIDLLYVYEPDDEEDAGAHALFHRLFRRLTAMLTEHTDESYLYRVDLRLRPMGRRGNIAYSLRQHAQYYATWGDTFERFALIKARPIAGDPDLGRRFVELVQPFVYRRYLDYSALEEIHRHKRRAEQAHGDVERDVKLGRGGIREVELFTQVLQLTYGAARAELRHTNTLAALEGLARAGLIAADVHADLARAYVFLRTVEHRVQMVQGVQTHAVSNVPDELARSARRMGFPDAASLEERLSACRARVHEIYLTLFEPRDGTGDADSRAFFRILAGEMSDAEAVQHLSRYGLADPAAALDVVRGLERAASLAASRTPASALAGLLAALLERVRTCARPDHVLVRFEQVTIETGAAASFLRTLVENEPLRDLLVSVLDLGELPARRLIRFPELLDSLLFALPPLDELGARYRRTLAALDPARRDDDVRRFKASEEFKALVEWISDGAIAALQVRLSLLAECCVEYAAGWEESEVAGARPEVPLPEWTILALGKLGGRELTAHSDLDLVVVYRGDPTDSVTFDICQRFVEALELRLERPTQEGVAYRIDTRLRPEGRKGALAIPLTQFRRYLETRAEIWERLAWTRARFVAGSRSLADEIEEAVTAFVYGPWDSAIPQYMGNVRARMERELSAPAGRALDFKVGRGGLADIDFLLQMIQIREGHRRPEFRTIGTRALIEALPDTALLAADEAAELGRAHGWLRLVEALARLDADAAVNAIARDPARLTAIGRHLRLGPSPAEALVETFERTTAGVRAIYERVLARL